MITIGVDPGLDGGIGVLSNGAIIDKYVMPITQVKQKKVRAVKKNENNPKGAKTKTYTANVKDIDYAGLRDIFRDIKKRTLSVGAKVYIESVSVRPGEGVSSCFKFGVGFGAIIATVACMNLEYELVRPNVWTSDILSGIPKNIETKDRSKLAASRLFNLQSFILDGCRLPHLGLIDAVLIATYGYRKDIARR